MARRLPTKVSGNYASGISLPFRGDGDGGVALDEGDPYILGQVLSTVSPNESDNPFQDIGGNEAPIFENADDVEWRQVARRRIQRQFGFLDRENLARLRSVKFGRGTADGDMNVLIEYSNLESTENRDVEVSLRAGEGLGTARYVPGIARSD